MSLGAALALILAGARMAIAADEPAAAPAPAADSKAEDSKADDVPDAKKICVRLVKANKTPVRKGELSALSFNVPDSPGSTKFVKSTIAYANAGDDGNVCFEYANFKPQLSKEHSSKKGVVVHASSIRPGGGLDQFTFEKFDPPLSVDDLPGEIDEDKVHENLGYFASAPKEAAPVEPAKVDWDAVIALWKETHPVLNFGVEKKLQTPAFTVLGADGKPWDKNHDYSKDFIVDPTALRELPPNGVFDQKGIYTMNGQKVDIYTGEREKLQGWWTKDAR